MFSLIINSFCWWEALYYWWRQDWNQCIPCNLIPDPSGMCLNRSVACYLHQMHFFWHILLLKLVMFSVISYLKQFDLKLLMFILCKFFFFAGMDIMTSIHSTCRYSTSVVFNVIHAPWNFVVLYLIFLKFIVHNEENILLTIQTK